MKLTKVILALILPLVVTLSSCSASKIVPQKSLSFSAQILLPSGTLQKVAATRFYILTTDPILEILKSPVCSDIEKQLVEHDKARSTATDYKLEADKNKDEWDRLYSDFLATGGAGNTGTLFQVGRNLDKSLKEWGDANKLFKYHQDLLRDLSKEHIRVFFQTPPTQYLVSSFDTDEEGRANISIKGGNLPLWLIGYVNLTDNELCLYKEITNDEISQGTINLTGANIMYNLATQDITWIRELVTARKNFIKTDNTNNLPMVLPPSFLPWGKN